MKQLSFKSKELIAKLIGDFAKIVLVGFFAGEFFTKISLIEKIVFWLIFAILVLLYLILTIDSEEKWLWCFLLLAHFVWLFLEYLYTTASLKNLVPRHNFITFYLFHALNKFKEKGTSYFFSVNVALDYWAHHLSFAKLFFYVLGIRRYSRRLHQ